MRKLSGTNKTRFNTVFGFDYKWVLGAICLLALVVHSPLFMGEFTNFDDGVQITNNIDVTNPSMEKVLSLFYTNYDRKNSNPMYMSFMLNWMITPGSYVGFLVFNLFLLIGTILCFFKFSQLFLRDYRWQLLATTLFAVHSVKADIVGWMSARCHFISMPFFLMAFYMWQRYREGLSIPNRVAWYLGAFACVGFTCISKNLFVVVLPLLVIYDLYTQRRLRLGFFLDKIPIAALAITVFLLPGRVAAPIGRTQPRSLLANIVEILPTDLNLLVQYLYQLVIPTPTALDVDVYPVDGLFDVSLGSSLIFMRLMPIVSLAILSGLLIGSAYLWRHHKQRLPFWFLVWAVVSLLPVMGFIPFWTDFAFRFCWVPVTLFCVTIVSLFSHTWGKLSHRGRAVAATVFGVYLTWHGVQTASQCSSYGSVEKYWTVCLQNFPDSGMCSYKLGQHHLARKEFNKAVEALSIEDQVKSQRKWNRKFRSGGMLSQAYKSLGDMEMASFYHQRTLLRSKIGRKKYLKPKQEKAARAFIKNTPVSQSTIDRFIESRKAFK